MTAARERLPGVVVSARGALVLVSLLFLARAILGAVVPLVPDEAYYALWSTRLSAGYFDHPPMIAWMIRPGTELFGMTPFGVRLLCLLSAIPASFFVWRAAAILVRDERGGPLAAVLFNVTMLGFFGLAVATPDAPLILLSAAMLYFAARLTEEPRPGLWLAMGLAAGLAFEAKYSAALMAAGFSLAVLAIPAWRRQLAGPWPWLSLLVAILAFSPNILWNAAHGFATVLKQGGRTAEDWQFEPQFLAEFFGAQIGLVTPLVFLFAVLGMLPGLKGAYRSSEARRILLFLVLVPTAYFVFHALRARVEGNWPGFLYPALAVSAAAAMLAVPDARRHLARLRAAAIPLALAILALASLYVAFAPNVGLGSRDPVGRLARGWPELAGEIDGLRRKIGASYVLTYEYPLNAELALHLPGVPVAQFNERERYAFLGEDPVGGLSGAGLLVTRFPIERSLWPILSIQEEVGEISKEHRGAEMARFTAYRVTLPTGP